MGPMLHQSAISQRDAFRVQGTVQELKMRSNSHRLCAVVWILSGCAGTAGAYFACMAAGVAASGAGTAAGAGGVASASSVGGGGMYSGPL